METFIITFLIIWGVIFAACFIALIVLGIQSCLDLPSDKSDQARIDAWVDAMIKIGEED
tara:strand:+ start:656 stop:832 length:177 start_codon:yes stop_codon:yes gene_type:complete